MMKEFDSATAKGIGLIMDTQGQPYVVKLLVGIMTILFIALVGVATVLFNFSTRAIEVIENNTNSNKELLEIIKNKHNEEKATVEVLKRQYEQINAKLERLEFRQ